MPLRVSRSYREAITHFLKRNKGRFSRTLLANKKLVREIERNLLSEKKRRQIRGLDRMMEESKKLGLYDGELEGVPRRRVPMLTTAQEAWLKGINCEAFSLEHAVKLYANRTESGATGVVVHTHKDGEAYEVEVLREDGGTVAVNTVTAGELLVELSEFVRNRSKK